VSAPARRLGLALGLALGLLAAVAHAADAPLRIGSKRFTESYIVAQLLAQTASAHAPTEVLGGLGNTAIVYEALRSGRIDLYPEYAGTIDLEILKNPQPTSLEAMRRQLAPLGLGIAIPLGFNDGYAIAMRADAAERLHIRNLSDLARHPELKLGLSNEFIGRSDGWAGLAARYGLPQKPTGIDHGLAYAALAGRQIDATDIYTTDAKIGELGLAVLDDDKHYFPRYDAVVLYRLDVPQRFPAAWQALQSLAGSIDERQMIAMNARAELQGVAFDVIARDFLVARRAATGGAAASAAAGASSGAIAPGASAATGPADARRGFRDKLFGADLGRLTREHLMLVVVSVAVAALIGIPLAIAVTARPAWRNLLIGTAGVLQTIPSLAMLALLISALGAIGTVPALIALTLYALLPIVRNTCTGLAEVPAGLKMAALALGLSRRDRLLQVELPLAFPTIIAGVRTATVICVGTATIAAFIGAGGYGERIVTGLALNDNALMVAGALPAALLALLCEGAFELFERRLRRG
jgi:osmoprotectant transport system permease protein